MIKLNDNIKNSIRESEKILEASSHIDAHINTYDLNLDEKLLITKSYLESNLIETVMESTNIEVSPHRLNKLYACVLGVENKVNSLYESQNNHPTRGKRLSQEIIMDGLKLRTSLYEMQHAATIAPVTSLDNVVNNYNSEKSA